MQSAMPMSVFPGALVYNQRHHAELGRRLTGCQNQTSCLPEIQIVPVADDIVVTAVPLDNAALIRLQS